MAQGAAGGKDGGGATREGKLRLNVSDGGFAAGDVFRRKEYGYKEVPLRKEYGESSGERESDLQVGQTILTPHRLGWTCFNNYSDASTV